MQSGNKLKPIKMIHLAFCAAIGIFAITVFSIVKDQVHFDACFDQDIGLYPLFPIMAAFSVFAGIMLFNKQISLVERSADLDAKLTKYQVAFLIRCAFLEGGSLMNISAFLISANLVFLLAAIVPFVFLVKYRPSKTEVIEDLDLQYPDTEQLD